MVFDTASENSSVRNAVKAHSRVGSQAKKEARLAGLLSWFVEGRTTEPRHDLREVELD
jgi:hypothetical protein